MPINRFAPFLLISLGAIFGANMRYLVNRGMARWLGTGFPYGTFTVNLVGSFVIGLVAAAIASRLVARPEVLRLGVMVGFLGSLTTFSSFAFETHSLFNDGEWMRALLNIFLSVFVGLAGVHLGSRAIFLMGGGR